MDPKKFDPFRNRRSRDIRNSLAKYFLESLAEKDVTILQKRAAGYLRRDLAEVQKLYVKKRVRAFQKVFDVIIQWQIDDKLQQAEIFWDYQLYFEMHELLEKVWVRASGDERKALQGLIRAAGMKIHAENGNIKAAVTMGRKALEDLQLYGVNLKRFNKLEPLLTEIKETLSDMGSLSDRSASSYIL